MKHITYVVDGDITRLCIIVLYLTLKTILDVIRINDYHTVSRKVGKERSNREGH